MWKARYTLGAIGGFLAGGLAVWLNALGQSAGLWPVPPGFGWVVVAAQPLVGIVVFGLTYWLISGRAPRRRFWVLGPVLVYALVGLGLIAVYAGWLSALQAIMAVLGLIILLVATVLARRRRI